MILLVTLWILVVIGFVGYALGFGNNLFSIPQRIDAVYHPEINSAIISSVFLSTLVLTNTILILIASKSDNFRKLILRRWRVYPWIIFGLGWALLGFFPWFGDSSPSVKTQIIALIIFYFPILTIALSVPIVTLFSKPTTKLPLLIFITTVLIGTILSSAFYLHYTFNSFPKKINDRMVEIAKIQGFTIFRPSYLPERLRDSKAFVCSEGFDLPNRITGADNDFLYQCAQRNFGFSLDINQSKNYDERHPFTENRKQIDISGLPAELETSKEKFGYTLIRWEIKGTKLTLLYSNNQTGSTMENSKEDQEQEAILIAQSMQEIKVSN